MATDQPFDLYPAIDLRGGRVVQLVQGDFARETAYGDDPVAVARGFAAAGAPWIHVVDLDAARTGEPMNRDLVAAVAAAVDVPVQAGGGIRSVDAAEALARAGVARVVVGTAAVEDPDLVERIAERQAVAVGLDVRGTEVAVHGWTAGAGVDVLDALARVAASGAEALVVTQIRGEGLKAGPDLDGLTDVLGATALPVIASGGVGSLHDLRALAGIDAGGRRLAGAIVGTALYDGTFTAAAAVAALSAVRGGSCAPRA
jgi:phosphoribosylformimino-5-aminoimidazole carboxamide ribotide isomerase